MSAITTVIPRLRCLLTTGLATLALLTSAQQAHATSGYQTTWRSIYSGTTSSTDASCQLCHGSSTQNLNPYGFDISTNCGGYANITDGINGERNTDSDGEGNSNDVEIAASAQPGWTSGAVPVYNRNSCASAGTNTAPGGVTVDPVVNQPPTADANGPYSGTAGSPVIFDGSGSSDPDGTIASYAWDFGDGGTGTGVSPTYTYAAAGTYTVTLTVTDDGGLTDSATSTATIVDHQQDPIAEPKGPYKGIEGQQVTFEGTGSIVLEDT